MGSSGRHASRTRPRRSRGRRPPAAEDGRLPLVLALRQVHRAGTLALTDLQPASATLTHVRGAIEAFELAVPGFKEARDALDHFDAYVLGIGDKQQPKVPRRDRQPRHDLADAHLDFYMRTGDDFVITIGDWSVSILTAQEASIALVYELDNAKHLPT